MALSEAWPGDVPCTCVKHGDEWRRLERF